MEYCKRFTTKADVLDTPRTYCSKDDTQKMSVCLRFQGGPYKVKPMAPLPTSKVVRSKAFTNTGLYYFGPLYIRQGKDRVKVWVCLFTCITVRAIHLKLVENMTAEQFLSAVRRFIAPRGKPDQIIPNFSNNAFQSYYDLFQVN